MVYKIFSIDHLNGATGSPQLLFNSEMNNIDALVGEPTLADELSKVSTLNFTVYSSHALYSSLNSLNTEIVAYEDEKEIFRGRIYNVSTSLWKERKVECESNLAYLNDSIQNPDRVKVERTDTYTHEDYEEDYEGISYDYEAYGSGTHHYTGGGDVDYEGEDTSYSTTEEHGVKETVAAHFTRLIQVHNSQVDSWKQFTARSITIDEANETVEFDASNHRDTMNAIKSDLMDYYGGYLRTERVGDVTYIDYIKDYGTTCSQTLTLGSNIVDISKEMETKDIFTCFVPVGNDDLTLEGATIAALPTGIERDPGNPRALLIRSGVNKYGKIYKSESFSDVEDQGQLVNMAVKYIQKNYKDVKIKFTITALNLKWLNPAINSFQIGEKVPVVSPPHEIDEEAVCIRREIRFLNPENASYTLGDPTDDMSTKLSRNNRKNSNNASDANSSARTAGGAGSHLYKTIKEVGEKLYITAESVDITTKQFRIFTTDTKKALVDIHDDIVEVNGKLKVYDLAFSIGSGNILMVNYAIQTPRMYVDNYLYYQNRYISQVEGSSALDVDIDVDVDYDTDSDGYVTRVWVSRASASISSKNGRLILTSLTSGS